MKQLTLSLLMVSLTACSHGSRSTAALPVPRPAVSLRVLGATPAPPWTRARVDRAHAPTRPVDIYLVRDGVRKPALILLQGSNCLPLFGERIRPDGRRSRISSNAFDGAEGPLRRAVHLALVERAGVRSFGPTFPASAWPPPRTTPACEGNAFDKRLRVRDVADVVLALQAQPWVSRVLVAGHSEGSDIATGVARLLGPEHVAAVGLFGGAGGASQFFDSAALARGEGRHDVAVAVMRDLLWMLAHRADGGRYVGVERYPIRRWVTFALDSTPIDDLRGLSLPVFVAHGSADKNVPIVTADLFVIERLRTGQRALAYRSVDGVDHGFRCGDGKETVLDLLEDFVRFALAPLGPDVARRAPCSAPSPSQEASR